MKLICNLKNSELVQKRKNNFAISFKYKTPQLGRFFLLSNGKKLLFGKINISPNFSQRLFCVIISKQRFMNTHATQIQFVGTTPADLISELKATLIPELEGRLSKQFQPKEPTEYLTRNEVCELLKIDLSTLWRWQRGGTLQGYGLGNRVYFKRSEIEEVISKNALN